MIPVLYFHGFASSPDSVKVRALRALLEPEGIALDTPDLNVPSFEQLDFEAMVRKALQHARAAPPRAIVGSSLGSLVALEVERRGVVAPLVLIAPAIGIRDQWLTRIPAGDPIRLFNHARGEEANIHRAFFEQMDKVDADVLPPAAPVTAFLGSDDESVPPARVRQRWRVWEASGKLAVGSALVVIDGGDHGLTAYVDRIAAAIVRSAG